MLIPRLPRPARAARRAVLSACAALWLVPGAARAEDAPVVVELFTSQGCAACPPADAFLRDLAARDDVLALSLHVDYWDYIGWTDTFGSPAHTARQRGYARARGQKMIYTPQVIVGGTDDVIGTHRTDVIDLIDAHLAQRPGDVSIEVTRDGGAVRLHARAAQPLAQPLVVQRLQILPEATVHITRGENAGRVAHDVNVVTGIERVTDWDTRTPLTLTMPAPTTGATVILLQQEAYGPIAAAARIAP